MAAPGFAHTLSRAVDFSSAARLRAFDGVRSAGFRTDSIRGDGIVVASGRVVTVFNIRKNRYRLVTAIHYRGERVYLLRFYTHSDYDDGDWKDQL